jgi:hypothetical protein
VITAILELDQSLSAPEEPMGIVISRGSRESAPPVFSAYVWGPAPDLEEERDEPRAA